MRASNLHQRIGIVVPTLGTRPEFLLECLSSIRRAGSAFVVAVAPDDVDLTELITSGLIDCRVVDPKLGLAAAIDAGIRALPDEIEYINWLGDDDVLTTDSLRISSAALDAESDLTFVYGGCDYIDQTGKILWRNPSGSWARWLLRIGPDLIPQPGALIRRSAYNAIGGLSPAYGWAFDLDLFLRLQSIGPCRHVAVTLASFRWHQGSLSVGARSGSSDEAREIRRRYLPGWARPFHVIWEGPFALADRLITWRLSAKSSKSQRLP